MHNTINRTIAPEAFPLNKIQLIHPHLKVLDNGMKIYCISGSEEDVIRLEFVFNTGMRAEKNVLISSATNHLLNAGTENMSSAEIMEMIDFYGAFYQHDNQLDRCSVSLYTLKKYFEETLKIFAECILNPIFPEHELETYKNNAKQRFLINNSKNDFRARREFHRILFPNHPYGKKVEVEDFDQLKRDDIIAYHQEHYKIENATIILSGNLNDEDLSILNRVFCDYSHKEKSRIDFLPVPKNEVLNFFEERPDSLQSAIRIGKQTIHKTHPDYIELSILTTVLGGYFGSRLMANIREDKGYTYGIGAGLYPLLDSSFFYIATEVGVEVTNNTLTEIYKEIERLSVELIPESELLLVKNYLKGAYIGSIENVFSHADKFKSLKLYNIDYEYYEQYFNLIENVTSERLLQLAQQYLTRNSLSEVVIGKK